MLRARTSLTVRRVTALAALFITARVLLRAPRLATTASVRPVVLSTASSANMGFEKVVIANGSGPKPMRGQTVTVHCTGYGKNRDLAVPFWSTKDAGQNPFTFQIGLGSVIKAWDEGVATMQLGEKATITATPDYAYGKGGFPAWGIMPDSTLRFEIEVLSIK